MWYPDPAVERLRQERQARTLYACVGVSIALHGLAMLSLPRSLLSQRPSEAPELTALLAPSPEPAAVPLPAPRKPRETRRAEIPTVQAVPEPAPVAAPRATEPEPASPPSPAPSQAVASAPPSVPSEAPVRLPVEDPGLLDAYRRALRDAADRYQRYPVQARQQGWEGRVEIRVVVDADGTMKSVLVKSSSRYQILDEQALDMVKKAFNALAQSRPVPRGREFIVDIPVVFELKTG